MTTKTKTPKTTAITGLEIAKGRQSVNAQQIFSIGGAKIRVRIKSDAYDFQSYATAEVWSAESLSWNEVHSIQPANMATQHGLAYKPTAPHAGDFLQDIDTLVRVAAEVIG